MNQKQLPLYNALLNFSTNKNHSFHVPGHKNGLIFPKEAQKLYEPLLSIDVTELRGLDDLHNATTIIKEAQDLASDYYQSKACFFLVGGSTVGNLAMIMATCQKGDTVIVQRNSHKSILNALKLAKVTPIFIEPLFDEEAQVAVCVEEELVVSVIKKYHYAKSVILTRPNYYGMTNEITQIVAAAHQYNIPVLIDEAHGAHFKHSSAFFPKSALNYGADVVVQSAHKTLPAMTMGSFLHYNSNNLVKLEKLTYYLQLLQSSSPSYPLMASLDLARYYLATLSVEKVEATLSSIWAFKNNINKIPQLKVINSTNYETDPLKVTVQSQCSLSGYDLQALFEKEGIYTELADPNNVLFIMPLEIVVDLEEIAQKIRLLLKDIKPKATITKVPYSKENSVSSLALSYEEIEQREVEEIPLNEAIGRINSEAIIPYPPGIPLLLSGEYIDTTHIKQILQLQKAGAYFQGESNFKRGINVFKKR